MAFHAVASKEEVATFTGSALARLCSVAGGTIILAGEAIVVYHVGEERSAACAGGGVDFAGGAPGVAFLASSGAEVYTVWEGAGP